MKKNIPFNQEENPLYWQKILSCDKNCQLAFAGLAKAALENGKYDEAMDYAKEGLDRVTYANAFKYINTEVSPIVGSEKQSEDLVMYLLSEFEENPVKIWDSNIFGKSLHELVNEGLHTKLSRMPVDARMRVQETIERVINEGCNGLVCIIL